VDQPPETKDVSTFHKQFCKLVGVPPSDLPPDAPHPPVGPKTLYGRALKQKKSQANTYALTASISNTLLLTQVVLGAAVTALGASASSHILITLFGATNTIIAGVVAYLKSRGQPMRARMYRDDLERVVDEIENSEIMWLGISKGMHGYSDINTDDEVTVRSEVARLTRLYDRAIRTNSMNNPDMYMAGGNEHTNLALRKGPSGPALPPVIQQPGPIAGPSAGADPAVAPAAPAAPVVDPDQSPATAPPKPPPKPEAPKEEKPKDENPKDEATPAKDEKKSDDSGLASPSSSKSNGKAPAEGGEAKEPNATAGASKEEATKQEEAATEEAK
jgi:hypothetical protein